MSSTSNDTVNSTSNDGVNSTSNDTISTNSTLNGTMLDYTSYNKTSYSYTFEGFLDYLMKNSMMSGFNKVPGGRKAFPFLCFLINID